MSGIGTQMTQALKHYRVTNPSTKTLASRQTRQERATTRIPQRGSTPLFSTLTLSLSLSSFLEVYFLNLFITFFHLPCFLRKVTATNALDTLFLSPTPIRSSDLTHSDNRTGQLSALSVLCKRHIVSWSRNLRGALHRHSHSFDNSFPVLAFTHYHRTVTDFNPWLAYPIDDNNKYGERTSS